eukprot:1160534-Pelagomonas_calceolata.AAC.32
MLAVGSHQRQHRCPTQVSLWQQASESKLEPFSFSSAKTTQRSLCWRFFFVSLRKEARLSAPGLHASATLPLRIYVCGAIVRNPVMHQSVILPDPPRQSSFASLLVGQARYDALLAICHEVNSCCQSYAPFGGPITQALRTVPDLKLPQTAGALSIDSAFMLRVGQFRTP